MVIIITIASGIVGGWLYSWAKDKFWGYRYKWKCPVCQTFIISSNSKAILEAAKATHTHGANYA